MFPVAAWGGTTVQRPSQLQQHSSSAPNNPASLPALEAACRWVKILAFFGIVEVQTAAVKVQVAYPGSTISVQVLASTNFSADIIKQLYDLIKSWTLHRMLSEACFHRECVCQWNVVPQCRILRMYIILGRAHPSLRREDGPALHKHIQQPRKHLSTNDQQLPCPGPMLEVLFASRYDLKYILPVVVPVDTAWLMFV